MKLAQPGYPCPEDLTSKSLSILSRDKLLEIMAPGRLAELLRGLCKLLRTGAINMDREINILTFEALVPPVLRSPLAIRSEQGCGGRILEVGGEGFRSLIAPAETIKGAELIEA